MDVKIKFINGYTSTTKDVVSIEGLDSFENKSNYIGLTLQKTSESIPKEDIKSITITL